VGVHLRGGQAYAGRIVHGLRHVIDQTLDAGIDGFDRLRHGVQSSIGVMEYV
jgi:hypothetical protein